MDKLNELKAKVAARLDEVQTRFALNLDHRRGQIDALEQVLEYIDELTPCEPTT